MKRTMTSWLATLAILLMLAAPVQADDTSEGETDNDGNGRGQQTSEDAKSQTRAAASQAVKEACKLVHIYTDAPTLRFDPLLGIVDFDPDDCYIVHVEGPVLSYEYTYDGRDSQDS